MMSFCKKKVHSFLSLSNSTSTDTSESPSHHYHHCSPIPFIYGCFCVIARDTQKPSNVLESDAIKTISSSTACKKDSITFLDNVGNGLNASCTESLGFESSDYPMEESLEEEELRRSKSTAVQSMWKTSVAKVRKQKTNFPPPLPSLNQNGQPSFYLKPLRRNGRLELTEVRIERPDIFKAVRQDGRLRLQLIRSEPQHPPPPYQDDDQIEEQDPLPLPSSPPPPTHDEEEEETIEEEDEISQEEEEEEEEDEIEGGKILRQWKLDGIRWRCQELNNHRPNHLLFGATIV
ncbi:hypothetical protein NE237_011087 [Protea cynaroides]|uniref:FAF domain-containing protein n=1 Tax=Protea cynaroides TaxID=273540 RepID=A0A9Q0JVI6_9MAGN|nr:hypothetical protein NE237_011087 [Protea cynaroides]